MNIPIYSNGGWVTEKPTEAILTIALIIVLFAVTYKTCGALKHKNNNFNTLKTIIQFISALTVIFLSLICIMLYSAAPTNYAYKTPTDFPLITSHYDEDAKVYKTVDEANEIYKKELTKTYGVTFNRIIERNDYHPYELYADKGIVQVTNNKTHTDMLCVNSTTIQMHKNIHTILLCNGLEPAHVR